MKKISFVILAAGKSKRMKSSMSKVLHQICDRSLLDYVNDLAVNNTTTDVNYVCSKEVKEYVKKNFKNAKSVIQKNRLGTAHAVQCAEKLVSKINNNVIVLFGDVPLIKDSTIKKLIRKKNRSLSIGTIVTFVTKKPFGYGRVITNNKFVTDVIEEKDTNSKEKEINLCNSGIMICDAKYLFSTIKKISNKNFQKERFLTDICKIAYNENKPFTFMNCNEDEVLGVNSTRQLIDLEGKFQKIFKEKLISKGVTLIDPDTIRISYDTKIGKDVIIEPNTIFKSGVVIKDSSKILSGSYLEGCVVGKNCKIGPYARIRPKTILQDNVKIGNFVEIKNSTIGNSSSISHLSYIGDSSVGRKVNIGAGTITCNYDGFKKNKTIIGDKVFIGSNCSLIAPIRINKNSTIGAGSVVTKNVAESSLAIERAKLIIRKKKNTKKFAKI
ncbi:MAG: Bifunctional protein GlmU [Alphaproteobacteria bacterium MarineAlpha5_Bin11]|nr:bifunctional N-acetylglucosamine-1-phosphate uridyltransferase/glucosamine-1-phosphate acetyltransferase [Pelagibacteraceae bacterium]PPR43763.1 MAG: Bifunctional protein GlmU [Alphaproteobacteria bacterium MarineAlpha5_Bin11]PPR51336.1 MAG: Bifunctional protein GlmU [Alphaproteobacteria bacterium MarineAlpha5_Bin10]|tara:strand:+ start:16784 stop:18103 length:1320 start_codon:yes stop_codon:yes gene_type:complete